jgi:acetylornithine deacetylase/succinyl-diaminopimelate desuccinylase
MTNKALFETLIDPLDLARTTEDLIRTPSYPGVAEQETAVARYIERRMTDAGIPCRLEEVIDGRANVIARLPGSGGGKTLLLCGHMDTVPPYDMPDALTPRREGDKIYGRGAADMKGPLASMDLIEKGLSADAAIIGEPSDLKLCVAHRGLEWFDFCFKGKTVHGGNQAEGINAISKAAHFICAVESELLPKLASRKDPLLGSPTLNIGVIHGGTQLSTVAGACTVSIDRRFIPEESYAEVCGEFEGLIKKLASTDPDFVCDMKVQDVSVMKDGYVHLPLARTKDENFIGLVQEKISQAFEQETEITSFPAWTDAGLLSSYAKIPTVVFGPGFIKCCHSPSEYIPLPHLSGACLAYALSAAEFCG